METDEIHLTKYATMALKAGKHVHMEKPGGVAPEAFEKLIALAKESDKMTVELYKLLQQACGN